MERLRGALQEIAQRFPGDVGVYVHHIESGMATGVDEDTPYGMASTYKVPILVELMTRVDAGDLRLDDRVEVQAEDQHIGSGLISALWAPGIEMSLRNVATFMIILSDNSATDILIDRLGADRITARTRALGFQNIRVDRTTLELILGHLGRHLGRLGNNILRKFVTEPVLTDDHFDVDMAICRVAQNLENLARGCARATGVVSDPDGDELAVLGVLDVARDHDLRAKARIDRLDERNRHVGVVDTNKLRAGALEHADHAAFHAATATTVLDTADDAIAVHGAVRLATGNKQIRLLAVAARRDEGEAVGMRA